MLGCEVLSLGEVLGFDDGDKVGLSLCLDGLCDGELLGNCDGLKVGFVLGDCEGFWVGFWLGKLEGNAEGVALGNGIGLELGFEPVF